MRFIFTFAIPSLLIGALPVEIVRDISLGKLLLVGVLAIFWFIVSINIFIRAIKKYESSNFMTFGNSCPPRQNEMQKPARIPPQTDLTWDWVPEFAFAEGLLARFAAAEPVTPSSAPPDFLPSPLVRGERLELPTSSTSTTRSNQLS